MGQSHGSNLDDYGFERYEENLFPIAYLLTWRTYGTWLHGDERTSNERSRDDRFGTIHRELNRPLNEKMSAEQRQVSVVLNDEQRRAVHESIVETCTHRGYGLRAANVRTNHAHAVVSALVKPEKVVNDLKAYATRRLREERLIGNCDRVWSRGASTRYLWKPAFVDAAIEYVLNSQGDVLFETVVEIPED